MYEILWLVSLYIFLSQVDIITCSSIMCFRMAAPYSYRPQQSAPVYICMPDANGGITGGAVYMNSGSGSPRSHPQIYHAPSNSSQALFRKRFDRVDWQKIGQQNNPQFDSWFFTLYANILSVYVCHKSQKNSEFKFYSWKSFQANIDFLLLVYHSN